MDWSDFVTATADIFEIPITNPASAEPSSSPGYNNILPRCIEQVELRLQRALDFLATYTTDATGTLTPNNRLFALPTDKGTYIVVSQVAPIVNGVRQMPMTPISREALDAFYPSDTALGSPSVPTFFAMYDNANILVGPAPDQAYGIEVVGTQRIEPLSATNTSNFLTLELPDLYLAAANVFLAGFQRDFGSQSENPQLGISWESTFQSLLKDASVEEARKKWAGVGWNSRMPSPISSPRQT